MTSYNRVILMGHLTRDTELRYSQSGQAIAKFSLAINNGKDKNGKEREADFFDVETWDKTAELASEYLKKGSGVLVEGRLKQDRWVDDSGQKRSRVKVVATAIQFLPKSEGNKDGQSKSDTGGANYSGSGPDDGAPF